MSNYPIVLKLDTRMKFESFLYPPFLFKCNISMSIGPISLRGAVSIEYPYVYNRTHVVRAVMGCILGVRAVMGAILGVRDVVGCILVLGQ